MNVVLIAPSGAFASALDLLEAAPDADQVTVVSHSAPDADSRAHSIVLRPALESLTRAAERASGGSAVGRNLLRLSPLDSGRRFAGAARRSTELRERLAGADLIVALERDGILTAWRAARRWARRDAMAVYGIAPAQTIMAAARR